MSTHTRMCRRTCRRTRCHMLIHTHSHTTQTTHRRAQASHARTPHTRHRSPPPSRSHTIHHTAHTSRTPHAHNTHTHPTHTHSQSHMHVAQQLFSPGCVSRWIQQVRCERTPGVQPEVPNSRLLWGGQRWSARDTRLKKSSQWQNQQAEADQFVLRTVVVYRHCWYTGAHSTDGVFLFVGSWDGAGHRAHSHRDPDEVGVDRGVLRSPCFRRGAKRQRDDGRTWARKVAWDAYLATAEGRVVLLRSCVEPHRAEPRDCVRACNASAS